MVGLRLIRNERWCFYYSRTFSTEMGTICQQYIQHCMFWLLCSHVIHPSRKKLQRPNSVHLEGMPRLGLWKNLFQVLQPRRGCEHQAEDKPVDKCVTNMFHMPILNINKFIYKEVFCNWFEKQKLCCCFVPYFRCLGGDLSERAKVDGRVYSSEMTHSGLQFTVTKEN